MFQINGAKCGGGYVYNHFKTVNRGADRGA